MLSKNTERILRNYIKESELGRSLAPIGNRLVPEKRYEFRVFRAPPTISL